MGVELGLLLLHISVDPVKLPLKLVFDRLDSALHLSSRLLLSHVLICSRLASYHLSLLRLAHPEVLNWGLLLKRLLVLELLGLRYWWREILYRGVSNGSSRHVSRELDSILVL